MKSQLVLLQFILVIFSLLATNATDHQQCDKLLHQCNHHCNQFRAQCTPDMMTLKSCCDLISLQLSKTLSDVYQIMTNYNCESPFTAAVNVYCGIKLWTTCKLLHRREKATFFQVASSIQKSTGLVYYLSKPVYQWPILDHLYVFALFTLLAFKFWDQVLSSNWKSALNSHWPVSLWSNSMPWAGDHARICLHWDLQILLQREIFPILINKGMHSILFIPLYNHPSSIMQQ